MISKVKFSDISKRQLLRCGAKYVDFWKKDNGEIFPFVGRQISLKQCVNFASAKTIKKGMHDETFQLIDLPNIEAGTGFFKNLSENVVSEVGSDKVYLSDADIVFSKLNSHLGYVFLPNEVPTEYPIIGSSEFYSLKVNSKLVNPKVLKYLFLHKLFREKASFLRAGKSQSHPRLQRDDFFNLRIPLLSQKTNFKIIKEIEPIEKLLLQKKDDLETLQDIIDEVLIKYKVKTKYYEKKAVLKIDSNMSNVAKQFALRIGSEYNSFWLNQNGNLFDSRTNEYTIVPLKRVIKQYPKTNLKKGVLEKSRILIEFEHVESPNGKIIDYTNQVDEIGSDKIEFGECDFLTNKLRPYLGYTVLNEPDLDLIGTTEFIPLQVRDKTKVSPEFIRYLLLSKDYLEQSKFLVSGNEHPRINVVDILNMKVPMPEYDIQLKIVEEILHRENQTYELKKEILTLREKIDQIILNEIGNI